MTVPVTFISKYWIFETDGYWKIIRIEYYKTRAWRDDRRVRWSDIDLTVGTVVDRRLVR